jgi:hypothetical protein
MDIYRVTTRNYGRLDVKVGNRKMLAGMKGEATSARHTANYRGRREPHYEIVKVERGAVEFTDVTSEFLKEA